MHTHAILTLHTRAPYYTLNRITLLRQCTGNAAFLTYLVIGPSRDRFAIEWFEMSDRRDVV